MAATSSGPFPTVEADNLGWLTEEQMIEVDRVMIEDLHIELIQMMENAGRNLARLVLDLCRPASVQVFAGSGGNGGGGLVAARHLANAGVDVHVALSRPAEEFRGVPAHQLDILQRMGLYTGTTCRDSKSDVAIDALIGYSLRGAPTGTAADYITTMAAAAEAIVSLDTPSGLNVTTGEVRGAAVSADATLTLAAPKRGLSESIVGDLYVADISVPPAVLRKLGAAPPDFAASPILHVS